MMKSMIILAMGIFSISLSMSVQAQKAGQTVQVFIGIVEDLKPLELKQDNTGRGVAAGATIGALRNSNNRTRSVVTGAVAGAAVGNATSKSQAGMQYAIRTGPNSLISIVSDQTEIHKGDCVSVQQSGEKGVISRIDSKKCEDIIAAAKGTKSSGNDACEKSKLEFANASTKDALDLAKQKMDVLCK